MGKRSVRENNNIYQRCREACGLSREAASDLLKYISPERIERIESELNEKRYYALKRCTEIMCENELYSLDRCGKIEDIRTIDSDRLKKAWHEMLSNAVIFVTAVGSMNAEVIRTRFEQRFDNVDRSQINDIHTEFITTPYETHRVREELPVKQGKLVIGYRAGMTYAEDNDAAIKVMADMFGGGV